MKIRRGREKEWEDFKRDRATTANKCKVLAATMYFGQMLDAGNLPEVGMFEASELNLLKREMEYVIQSIWYFHPRGNEVRRWFQRKFKVQIVKIRMP
jgi:hypothetical protein